MKKVLGAIFVLGAAMATSLFAHSGSSFSSGGPQDQDICIERCWHNSCPPPGSTYYIWDLYCENWCEFQQACTTGVFCVSGC